MRTIISWSGVAIITAAALSFALIGLSRIAPILADRNKAPAGAPTASVAVSPDGSQIAVIRDDGGVDIQSPHDEWLGRIRGHGVPVVDALFINNGTALRTVDENGGIMITKLDRLDARERMHAEDLAKAAKARIWDKNLAEPANRLHALEWNIAPWAQSRQITVADNRAPILPEGVIPKPGTMFRDCEHCPEMVVIAAEEPIPKNESNANTGPTQPFAVGRFEVTVREFSVFVEETGYVSNTNCSSPVELGRNGVLTWDDPGFTQTPDHPVVCISQIDAQRYLYWLNIMQSPPYRTLSLPEWTQVSNIATPASTDRLRRLCATEHLPAVELAIQTDGSSTKNFICDLEERATQAVSAPGRTEFGLFHLLGNTREYLSDCDSNTVDLCMTSLRTIGSWHAPLKLFPDGTEISAGVASGFKTPDRATNTTGFRVARDVEFTFDVTTTF